MNSAYIVLAVVVASLVQAPAPQTPARAEPPRIRIECKVEPFLDLWFAARTAGASESEDPAWIAGAAAKFRAAGTTLGSPLAWWPIEARIATCQSAAEARAACAQVPETFDRRGGSPIPLRALALDLVESLAAIEPEFREKMWPADGALVRAAERELGQTLLAHIDEVVQRHGRALGFDEFDLAIPCALVARMPKPGAITHRAAGGQGFCFVGVEGLTSSTLSEVVLHEATHALDVARDGDLFDSLRERLEAAGVARTDRLWRDAPHTVMFCASAAAVRATLDPRHVDYGEQSGYFAKVGATADLVRKAWGEIEAQQLGPSAAVDLLVAALVPAPPANPAPTKPR
jgi:hypothetical protein